MEGNENFRWRILFSTITVRAKKELFFVPKQVAGLMQWLVDLNRITVDLFATASGVILEKIYHVRAIPYRPSTLLKTWAFS